MTTTVYNLSNGGSEEVITNPASGIHEEILLYTGPNATGTLTEAVVDFTAGNSEVELANPERG